MIELDDVSKEFCDRDGHRVRAVDRVSLRIGAGETLGLIGTSGSGKTTTMRMINRLEEPTSGSVRVFGRDVRDQDPVGLRRRIGYVIQAGGLLPHRTVRQNIALLCRLEGWSPERTRDRVSALLEMVNLPEAEFGDRYPGELSGGQRQRVGVARALVLDPECVLMDEPFGALDPITREQMHAEFLELWSRVKKTVVLVTHDLGEARRLSDRIAIMHEGRLMQVGPWSELVETPASEFVASFVGREMSS